MGREGEGGRRAGRRAGGEAAGPTAVSQQGQGAAAERADPSRLRPHVLLSQENTQIRDLQRENRGEPARRGGRAGGRAACRRDPGARRGRGVSVLAEWWGGRRGCWRRVLGGPGAVLGGALGEIGGGEELVGGVLGGGGCAEGPPGGRAGGGCALHGGRGGSGGGGGSGERICFASVRVAGCLGVEAAAGIEMVSGLAEGSGQPAAQGRSPRAALSRGASGGAARIKRAAGTEYLWAPAVIAVKNCM